MVAAIEIQHLNKTYRDGTQALLDVNLSVRLGDFFALLGPNGAGKSTLIGVLTSLVIKNSSQVIIGGFDIDKDFAKAKACMGVVVQEYNLNIFDRPFNIMVDQAGFYGVPRKIAKQRAEHYLKKLELWDKRKNVVHTLSGGMKRRLMIARAMMNQPEILILDEPTAGVDIELRRTMWDFIKELNANGTTIILTTHYLEEAEALCRNIAIINHGKIITDTSMAELIRQLNYETFVLDLVSPCRVVPEIPHCQIIKLDNMVLEVTLKKEHDLNHFFTEFSRHGIYVASLRNKSSRLEQLFVNLTDGGDAHGK